MPETTDNASKPPYLSFTTLKNFLLQLNEGVIPSRIDKSLMPGQSGSTQSYILNALQFFDLIDEKGVPKDGLQALVEAVDNEISFKAAWRKVFLESYESILAGLDLLKATPDELKEKFRVFDYGGDTLRKCHVFFIAAADAGGVQVANHLRNAGRASSSGKKSASRKSGGGKSSGADEPAKAEVPVSPAVPEGMNLAILPLNATKSRYIKLEAPLTITKAELERIKQWLSFQLIVEESSDVE